MALKVRPLLIIFVLLFPLVTSGSPQCRNLFGSPQNASYGPISYLSALEQSFLQLSQEHENDMVRLQDQLLGWPVDIEDLGFLFSGMELSNLFARKLIQFSRSITDPNRPLELMSLQQQVRSLVLNWTSYFRENEPL